MRIVVYEHVSGGGYAGQPLPPQVLCEGYGMLRTFVCDLKAAGHQVTVLLDGRLSKQAPPFPIDSIVPVFYPLEPERFMTAIASTCDAVFIIAPETGQTLQSLVETVEKTGKISLNCNSSIIQKVADKATLYEELIMNGLPTPKTVALTVSMGAKEIEAVIERQIGFPAVFKLADGVSCGGLSIVTESAQLEDAIAKLAAESGGKFIVQRFVHGEAASVSLLCADGEAKALSLNRQNVKLAAPNGVSSYEGGVVPFDHPQKEQAFALAERVVSCFSGLRGYVGVDLVLSKDGPVVVDVNPRLTTSYVGLVQVAGFNVAEAAIQAATKKLLPKMSGFKGYAAFSKLHIPQPTIKSFKQIAKLSEVIAPPFALDTQPETSMLLSVSGENTEDAEACLRQAQKHVFSILGRGN